MEYIDFNNESIRIIIYREDGRETEIVSKRDQDRLLIVIDTVGILLVYEVLANKDNKVAVLHSGYSDWLSFETRR